MNNGMENDSNLKEAIIKVIAFFDMFDWPLTAWEIWQNSEIKCELVEVMEMLENTTPLNPPLSGGQIQSPHTSPHPVLPRCCGRDKSKERGLRGQIENKNGFYYLGGRSAIIAERLKRYNSTGRKFKRALVIAKIYKFIPWIKLVAMSNLLGAHNLREDSDIDLFIITQDKRLWITRFFCVGIIKLLGWRPQADNSRDKICLNFYVSDQAMDLSDLMLTPDKTPRLHSPNRTMEPSDQTSPHPVLPRCCGRDKSKERELGNITPLNPPLSGGRAGGQINPPYPPTLRSGQASLLKGADNVDIYFTYWLAGLTPLYDQGGIYEKFIQANGWLKNYLPDWEKQIYSSKRTAAAGPSGFYRDVVDLFFGGLEPQFKALQLKILPAQLKKLMNQDSRVVVNDQVIKLHANDRREEYRKKYQEKIRELR